MDYFCAGYWNLSSFYKVFPRFFIPSYSESDSFFLFSRLDSPLESVESGVWTFESTYGFEIGFIIFWDWFHIFRYWFCFCSHFWRNIWTTKVSIFQARISKSLFCRFTFYIPNLQPPSILLWFVIRKLSGNFTFFPRLKLYEIMFVVCVDLMRFREWFFSTSFWLQISSYLIITLTRSEFWFVMHFAGFFWIPKENFITKISGIRNLTGNTPVRSSYTYISFSLLISVVIWFWYRFASLCHDHRRSTFSLSLSKFLFIPLIVRTPTLEFRLQTSLNNKSMSCVSAILCEQLEQVTEPPRISACGVGADLLLLLLAC